ncbi:MAG: nuclear transport factor 2 family protein [Thermodesulfobacteriota bacterium]
MSDSDRDKIRKEVLESSQNWIANFNNGDARACIDAYTIDAVLYAKPFGTFRGIQEIESFWKPFIETGAGDLEYSNVSVAIENETTVLLTADWEMNVGRGIITMERWVKRGEGKWLLEFDDFEVQEQY